MSETRCVKCGQEFTPVFVNNDVQHIACAECVPVVRDWEMQRLALIYSCTSMARTQLDD